MQQITVVTSTDPNAKEITMSYTIHTLL